MGSGLARGEDQFGDLAVAAIDGAEGGGAGPGGQVDVGELDDLPCGARGDGDAALVDADAAALGRAHARGDGPAARLRDLGAVAHIFAGHEIADIGCAIGRARNIDAVVAIGRAIVPRRPLAAGGDMIIGVDAVVIGDAGRAEVVIGGGDGEGFCGQRAGGEGAIARIARLAEHRVDDVGLGDVLVEAGVFGELHHRGEGCIGFGFRSLAGHPGYDVHPAVARDDLERLVEADFLERPEIPPDAVALDERDRVAIPAIAVLARLAEPDRAVIAGAQRLDFGDARFVVAVPIFMKAQHHIGVPRGRQALVIIAPAIALDDHDMLFVDLADRRGDPLLQAPDRLILGLVAAIALAGGREAPVGLVDQVIGADPRLILVARGELGPQHHGLALVFLALPERRLRRVAVGDGEVVALTAGRGVEIEDQVDAVRLAPREQTVDAPETLLVPCVLTGLGLLVGGQGELVEMDWQPHRVEAPFRHRGDVGLGRVVVEPGAVEGRGALLADEFDKFRANFVLLPDLAEFQHIAFLQHPAAESHAAQDDGFARSVDDLGALDLQKALGVRGGRGKRCGERESDGAEVHDLIPMYSALI
eukprot:Opistho-1_new@96765